MKDYDVSPLFKSEAAVFKPTVQQQEARKRRIDSEKYYFEVKITIYTELLVPGQLQSGMICDGLIG